MPLPPTSPGLALGWAWVVKMSHGLWFKSYLTFLTLILLACKMGTVTPLLFLWPARLTCISAQPTPGPAHSRGFTNTHWKAEQSHETTSAIFVLSWLQPILFGWTLKSMGAQIKEGPRIHGVGRWDGGGSPLSKRYPTSRRPAPSPGLPHPLLHQPLPGEEGGGRGEGGREGGREPQRPRPGRTPPGITELATSPKQLNPLHQPAQVSLSPPRVPGKASSGPAVPYLKAIPLACFRFPTYPGSPQCLPPLNP